MNKTIEIYAIKEDNMNSVRIIGELIETYDGCDELYYKVRVKRSGGKDIYDDIHIILNYPFVLDIGTSYEFVGMLGHIVLHPYIPLKDVCVFVDDIYAVPEGSASYSEIALTGVITRKLKVKTIPNRVVIMLTPDESHDSFRVVAWNRRVEYITRVEIGARFGIWGELVTHTYKDKANTSSRTEVAFWHENKM